MLLQRNPKEWIMMENKGAKKEKRPGGGGNVPYPQLQFHLATIYIYSDSFDAKHSAL